jgi:hypothetical protein
VLHYSGIGYVVGEGSLGVVDTVTDVEEVVVVGTMAGSPARLKHWKAVCLSWKPACVQVRTLQHATQ